MQQTPKKYHNSLEWQNSKDEKNEISYISSNCYWVYTLYACNYSEKRGRCDVKHVHTTV